MFSDNDQVKRPAPTLQKTITYTYFENMYAYRLVKREIVGDVKDLIALLKTCQLKKDADCLPTPELALKRAAAVGNIDTVREIVDRVKDLKMNQTIAGSGHTALDLAKMKGHEEIAEFLLSSGAIPRAKRRRN